MLKEKVIVAGYNDTSGFLTLLDKLKQTITFTYHIVSATMARGLAGILGSMKPDLVNLSFRNNQNVLNEIGPLTVQLLIPQKMNKFSAGGFCFFAYSYFFNGVQASYAGLFGNKKKELIGGGGPVPIFHR
ncbi:hypothetical protein [Pedobacter miscanthi]|uniref:hypothetical protein n=1 Tax=Pedobacter miscanthi TaxID=2259170 RepID=UPI002931424C|nr:hypothetical protein [Pedobacter miscanthi]